MRKFLIATCVLVATCAPLSTHAQVTCQTIGQFQYCDNGLQSQQLGGITYYNNGVTRQRLGNFDYYSQPTAPPVYQPPQPIYIPPSNGYQGWRR